MSATSPDAVRAAEQRLEREIEHRLRALIELARIACERAVIHDTLAHTRAAHRLGDWEAQKAQVCTGSPVSWPIPNFMTSSVARQRCGLCSVHTCHRRACACRISARAEPSRSSNPNPNPNPNRSSGSM
jgi:hypothetical protein